MAIYQQTHVIGGNGGGEFFHNAGSSGRLLRKFGMWVVGWTVTGIRVWWTGLDDPTTYGTPHHGPYKEFTFEDGERFTSLSIWGNGAGTRTGGIKFQTNQGREFFHHMTSWGLKQEYTIDIASGLCVGIMGRCGSDIDCVGFLFLRHVSSAQMIDVSYPTIHHNKADTELVTLDAFSDVNRSNRQTQWKFSGVREVKRSSSWGKTNGIESHVDITVSAGIPDIAKIEGKFGWVQSRSATYTMTQEETHILKWERSGVLGPNESISIQALVHKGSISVPYRATMKITFQNGDTFSYPIASQYNGVQYTNVEIRTS